MDDLFECAVDNVFTYHWQAAINHANRGSLSGTIVFFVAITQKLTIFYAV